MTLFFFCISYQAIFAQGALQEGVSLYRALDSSSATGSTALDVEFDASGNATITRSEVRVNESDVETVYFFTQAQDRKNAEGKTNLKPTDEGEYFIVDFASESAERMTGNMIEVSCTCSAGGGACKVIHTQEGDLQQTFCDPRSGCSQCKLEVTSSSRTFNNSILVIQAVSVDFQ
jgi:hypothetical protein